MEREVEESSKKNQTSKKGERKEKVTMSIDMKFSSDKENNPSKSILIFEGPAPKRKGTQISNVSGYTFSVKSYSTTNKNVEQFVELDKERVLKGKFIDASIVSKPRMA
ncbi:hypothetical protein HAX54_043862, partial [Datura stramonium]|nr:hypothetical protein [Datura stramonium]